MVVDGRVNGKQKVLIVGGGVAGIEAALALRDLAGGRVEVDLYDPRREFVYRPFAVGEPYGVARGFRYDLGRLSEHCDASFHRGGIVTVDPGQRLALTRDGDRIPYDHLIVATGARMLWAVPGAITFWGAIDEGQVREVIADLRAGRLRRLVLTMPGGYSWTLPLYELALLAVTELGKLGTREGRVTVVTPEDLPLGVFGRYVSEQMSTLLAERGVEVITGTHPLKFEDRRLHIASGERIDADAVVSLPRLEGRRVSGIPHDEEGFVGVDEHGGVIGLERVYAAGDVTAFPVKQGGMSTQQADTVAEAIAAAAGAGFEARPFDPTLRAVLWTGREPRYLYGSASGGDDEASSFSERPHGPLRSGKVTARYWTPLVDSLSAESDSDDVPPLADRISSAS
ncbi:MAG TPA: NAD(P)/FAD-dependent oxidoreductase [Solirubrobacterales bacterium]|nr:NAD(P)/FAD-dependent oxidoreductase [Solirubrobacterales bacterium]